MKINYQITLEDAVDFQVYHITHSPSSRRRMTNQFLLINLFAIVLDGIVFYSRNWHVESSSLLLLGGTLILVNLYQYWEWRGGYRKRARDLALGEKAGFEPTELELLSSGILSTSPSIRTSVDWKLIRRVVTNDKHIYIYVSENSAVIIPKNAFRTADEIDKFLALINEHINTDSKQ